MITLKTEEMACGHCVERIDKALKNEGIAHNIDLDTKTVQVDVTEEELPEVVELLDDLGFTAKKVME